jgi:predicted nucleotidyltransferase
MERELVFKKNVIGILSSLKKRYNPEKIIVFGSYATGNIKETSDIDILIVKKTKKHFIDRLKEVAGLCDYDVGVDFLVYTPEEIKKMQQEHNYFIVDEVLAKGKVMYEK